MDEEHCGNLTGSWAPDTIGKMWMTLLKDGSGNVVRGLVMPNEAARSRNLPAQCNRKWKFTLPYQPVGRPSRPTSGLYLQRATAGAADSVNNT